jgi:hypothetical protein
MEGPTRSELVWSWVLYVFALWITFAFDSEPFIGLTIAWLSTLLFRTPKKESALLRRFIVGNTYVLVYFILYVGIATPIVIYKISNRDDIAVNSHAEHITYLYFIGLSLPVLAHEIILFRNAKR